VARTECYCNFLCNLSDRYRSVQMISRTRATVPMVWKVDGLPGWGSSLKDQCPLLKREYHSNVFDRLRQDSGLSESCLQHFIHFSTSFPQMETEINAHTLLHFPHHPEMRRTLQVDVHWKGAAERMRRDTDLRFCTYICTELTRVPLCCHFATYYSFPGRKSVLELNDQPT